MNSFSFNSSSINKLVNSNPLPILNIQTQNNNYNSVLPSSSLDHQSEVPDVEKRLLKTIDHVVEEIIPKLMNKLLDARLVKLDAEKILNETFGFKIEKPKSYTSDEITYIIKQRGDNLFTKDRVLIIFPMISTIR
jgi:hypothetical protein